MYVLFVEYIGKQKLNKVEYDNNFDFGYIVYFNFKDYLNFVVFSGKEDFVV